MTQHQRTIQQSIDLCERKDILTVCNDIIGISIGIVNTEWNYCLIICTELTQDQLIDIDYQIENEFVKNIHRHSIIRILVLRHTIEIDFICDIFQRRSTSLLSTNQISFIDVTHLLIHSLFIQFHFPH